MDDTTHETPRRRPRVVLIAHDVVAHGGMERALYELVAAAHDRVDFTVVSIALAEDLRPFVRWRRVPAITRPFIVKYVAFFVLAGFRYRRRDVDLVHTMGAILPRRADVMAIHFCHAAYAADTAGMDLEADVPLLRRLNIAAAFQVGLRTEGLFANSRWARTATAVSAGGKRELSRFSPSMAVTVIPNGVDQLRFAPSEQARREVREQAGAPEDVVALFVGGRWTQKGLDVTIEALAHARARSAEPLTLWVAGSGDISRYQALADRLGVGEHVHFFGYVKDTERLYQGADLFVLPSAYETFCMVAYEAASSGLPVVATAVNGVDDLLSDGAAGIVVTATTESVGDAMLRLTDADLRRSMGDAGRRRVQEFTWASTADQTVRLYESLLPAAPREGQA